MKYSKCSIPSTPVGATASWGRGKAFQLPIRKWQETPVKSYKPQEPRGLWHFYFNMTIHFNTFLCPCSPPRPGKEEWCPCCWRALKGCPPFCNLMLTSWHPVLSLESRSHFFRTKAPCLLSVSGCPLIKHKEHPWQSPEVSSADGITYHILALGGNASGGTPGGHGNSWSF